MYFVIRLLALFCLFSSWAAAAVLENAHWRVELQPDTLALSVTPTGQATVAMSSGGPEHRVSALHSRGNTVSWQWDEGAYALEVHLHERELQFSVRAQAAGELILLRQPGAAMGEGLIWPMAEGHYVPAGDPLWQAFLLDQGALDTTQDLSLPLWGVDHGLFSLHWLLTTPWNNRVRMSQAGLALGVELSHHFTPLDPNAPMTWVLYLGDASPLSGARHYRETLIEQGRYQSLESKLREVPEGRKLLGASHVYLWGSGLLGPQDIRSWPELLRLLRGTQPLAIQLHSYLSDYSRELLDSVASSPQAYQRQALLRGLNGALQGLARASWQGVDEPDMDVLAERYGQLRAEVAKTFASALSPDPQRWGDGFSLATLEALQAAGLQRLWLGLGDAWEGGLWHPQTVQAAVQAGYLVTPYDSYETALPPDGNPDWTTGHLGAHAHGLCAVIMESGHPRKGFQQSGHYTDPRCMQPLMEQRVRAIQARSGFNSWFLDVTAAGMLFDSYRPGSTMTQAQNAEGNVRMARWLGEQQLVVGSENGNGVTAEGIFYAHGMQTPVMGWGDADLMKNTQSPFYLGNWYPPEAPTVFFKPVPLKEPYRKVHFAPQTRLPLYQTVFHGSVITSHHWGFDNLKLSNVREDNELAQLLYNVAPLYHLSSASLASRLPLMRRHDRFFRPLHERLASKALTGFHWLSEDRLLQQTTFGDGSIIVANFAPQPRGAHGHTLDGHSVMALLADGSISHYRSGEDAQGSSQP